MPDDITVKRRYGQCQSVVAVFVDHGNDITAQLAHSELNSIHANEITGLYRAIVLWSAGLCGEFFNGWFFPRGPSRTGINAFYRVPLRLFFRCWRRSYRADGAIHTTASDE